MQQEESRRDFLKQLAGATSAVVLAPTIVGCGRTGGSPQAQAEGEPTGGGEDTVAGHAPLAVPRVKPADWDPVAFNKARGNAGAIPESYRDDINGPDGDAKHLGKHLPYVAETDPGRVPAGMVALMWGDPAKGHARHPNARRSEDNPEGHWYNWIRIRRAVDGDAQEAESRYRGWPDVEQPGDGAYTVKGGGDITADGGKNTIYLARLPDDVRPGDMVRIHAHCLTHGEYVDFLTV